MTSFTLYYCFIILLFSFTGGFYTAASSTQSSNGSIPPPPAKGRKGIVVPNPAMGITAPPQRQAPTRRTSVRLTKPSSPIVNRNTNSNVKKIKTETAPPPPSRPTRRTSPITSNRPGTPPSEEEEEEDMDETPTVNNATMDTTAIVGSRTGNVSKSNMLRM